MDLGGGKRLTDWHDTTKTKLFSMLHSFAGCSATLATSAPASHRDSKHPNTLHSVISHEPCWAASFLRSPLRYPPLWCCGAVLMLEEQNCLVEKYSSIMPMPMPPCYSCASLLSHVADADADVFVFGRPVPSAGDTTPHHCTALHCTLKIALACLWVPSTPRFFSQLWV